MLIMMGKNKNGSIFHKTMGEIDELFDVVSNLYPDLTTDEITPYVIRFMTKYIPTNRPNLCIYAVKYKDRIEAINKALDEYISQFNE